MRVRAQGWLEFHPSCTYTPGYQNTPCPKVPTADCRSHTLALVNIQSRPRHTQPPHQPRHRGHLLHPQWRLYGMHSFVYRVSAYVWVRVTCVSTTMIIRRIPSTDEVVLPSWAVHGLVRFVFLAQNGRQQNLYSHDTAIGSIAISGAWTADAPPPQLLEFRPPMV